MMRFRGTLTLLLLAAGLFGYILLFERDRPEPVDAATGLGRVFPGLDPASVTALVISQTNGTFRVERSGGGWQLTTPAHPALAMLIEPWLESLVQLRRVAHLEAAELRAQPGGLAAMGLEPPRVTVTLEQGARRFQFRIGQRAPLGERMYLQVVGSDGVDITGSQPLELLPLSAAQWRDPALVHMRGARVDRMVLRTASREYQVEREGATGLWRLARPRPARADQARVEQMLQQLREARVTQFATDIVTADLEPYGLQTPAGEMTLFSGTNALMRLAFGHSPTNAPDMLYVQRSTPPGVVVVPRGIFDAVAVPYTDLVDYRMVDPPLDRLQRIEVEVGGGTSLVLEKNAESLWRLTSPLARPTDPALVSTFLDKLRGLKAVEVAKEIVEESELPSYGLVSPLRRYTLTWAGPGTNAGPVLRLDLGTNRADRVMARRSDENPVYALSLGDCVALPAFPLQLRDRRIWDFRTNEVQAITITHHGKARRLLRSPAGQWTFAPGSQGMVNTFALEEAIHRIGQLRATWWEAEGAGVPLERYGVPQVAHQLSVELQIHGRAETRVLDFGATSRSGGPYGVVQLEGGPAVFEVPLDIFNPYDQVTRSMDLPKPDAAASPP